MWAPPIDYTATPISLNTPGWSISVTAPRLVVAGALQSSQPFSTSFLWGEGWINTVTLQLTDEELRKKQSCWRLSVGYLEKALPPKKKKRDNFLWQCSAWRNGNTLGVEIMINGECDSWWFSQGALYNHSNRVKCILRWHSFDSGLNQFTLTVFISNLVTC